MSATPPETRHDEPLTIEATPFSRPEFARRQSRRSLSPVTVITGILLILLLAVTWLVFSARAVRLEFDQPTTDVTVSGGLSYLLGERYLMLTGEYQVTARAEGFHELRAPLTVTTEADQTMQFSFSPLPGILQIVSAPESGAEVFIDQQSVGITPLTIDSIEPGLHDVSLRSARFLPWDSDISIEGRRQRQTLTADLSPAWALLDISSSPAGASISIDGEAAGTTPATVEAVQGPRQITISLAGYKSWQNTLDIEAGQNQVLPEVQLIRADGKVSLSSEPAGANVTVNNDFRGITPLALSLAPGEQYRIRLTRAGYQPAERQLDLAAGDAVDLNIRLNPVVGKVRIQVTPGDATLTIDGKPAGVASQLLSLTTRPHTIVVSKPGYASFETTIVPQADVARQLIVNLQTEDEARIAAIPTEISTSAGQQLRLIYPGTLTMGADRREPGRRSNEIQKTVELTRPYYLGVHEVTNAEYRQFNRNHDSGVLGRSLLSEEDRPVVNLSWSDAVRYCNWLSQREGLPPAYEQKGSAWVMVQPLNTGYRLPTEAEWAWAARYADGPTPSRFPWGDAMPPVDVSANYADETAENMVPYTISGYNDTFRGPAPVGSFEPNAFGIYDLAGNVSEWIHDVYSLDLQRDTLTDPMGPETGEYHVIRGSSYTHGRFSELRWTYRDYGDKPRTDVGFRLARYLE